MSAIVSEDVRHKWLELLLDSYTNSVVLSWLGILFLGTWLRVTWVKLLSLSSARSSFRDCYIGPALLERATPIEFVMFLLKAVRVAYV